MTNLSDPAVSHDGLANGAHAMEPLSLTVVTGWDRIQHAREDVITAGVAEHAAFTALHDAEHRYQRGVIAAATLDRRHRAFATCRRRLGVVRDIEEALVAKWVAGIDGAIQQAWDEDNGEGR